MQDYTIPSLEIEEYAASADPISASPDAENQLGWDENFA